MRKLFMALAYARSIQLSRELKSIERIVGNMTNHQRERLAVSTLRELKAASKDPFPHLYSSQADMRYRPWGDGTRVAWERIRSANNELRAKGISLWIAVAFYETQQSQFQSTQGIYRRLVKVIRELRQDAEKAVSKGRLASFKSAVA